MQKSKRYKTAGQSLVEAVVVLPFFFILLFAIFEWGQIFIKHMRASTINREAALVAHHECKGSVDAVAAELCLNRVRNSMMERAATVFPEFNTRGEIILSLYGGLQASAGGGGTYTSHFNSGNVDANLINSLGTVAICEIFYDIKMLTAFESMFNFVMPNMIYKSTFL